MDTASAFTTEEFRRLADKANQLRTFSNEADVVARFGTDFSGVQPVERWKTLHALIQASVCVPTAGEVAFTSLQRLRRSVVLEGALGCSTGPYVAILRTLADACREGYLRPFADEAAWHLAVQAAQALQVLDGGLPELNLREAAVVAAGKRLVDAGAALRVADGRFTMDESELTRLACEMDNQAAVLGGICVVEQVVAWLVAGDFPQFGRYGPARRFDPGRTNPSFPAGYMLQIGVKHLKSPPALSSRRPELWESLVRQATDLCTVLDVEPYTNLEDANLVAVDVPSYLASVALFDHLFALKQWPPSRAHELLRGVTSGLDATEMRSRVGWDLADMLLLLDAILTLATQPFVLVTPQDLERAGVSSALWHTLWPSFVHPLGGVNGNYVSPLDANKAEFDFKPLFALPRDHLLIVTPSLACLGFFEAATRALRDAGYPDLDAKLGEAVEKVVATALRNAGLNVSVEGVEYIAKGGTPGEPTGECDVVVETEHLVTFLELKKKPLRRVSATGDAAPALVDLSTSLFAAQAQLARHEQVLLRDGEIAFANGYTLELRDRRIVSISVE